MRISRRGFVKVVGTGTALGLAGTVPGADTPQAFQGKVVRLAEVIARAGGKLDADAQPFWLALQAEDGKIYPLVKDGGSRLFFKDPALLNRPLRLEGRL